MALPPLFDCDLCRGCCHFEESGEVWVERDEVNRVAAEIHPLYLRHHDDWYYMPVSDGHCAAYDAMTGHCSMWPDNPLTCHTWPLMLIGQHVVIHSDCPDARRFIKRFQAGETSVQLFVLRVKRIFQRLVEGEAHPVLDRIRREAADTNLLFSFGTIDDADVLDYPGGVAEYVARGRQD
jgi:Fe-S-cluster containining protein